MIVSVATVVVILAACLPASCTALQAIPVRQCATVSLAEQDGSPLRFDPVAANVDLELGPFPIPVQPGQDVGFKLGFDLLRDVAGDTVVKLAVTRNFIFNLRMPCIEVPGFPVPLGSCTYTLFELLGYLRTFGACDKFFGAAGCPDLPIKAGHYRNDQPVVVTLPKVIPKEDGLLKGLIGGTYGVTLKLVDQTTQTEITCVNFKLELTSSDVRK